MWKLLQNEFSYHGIFLIVMINICIQLLFYSITSFYEHVNFMILTLFTIVFFSVFVERNRISADRQSVPLPIPVSVIGIERSLLILSPFSIMIPSIFLLNYLLIPSAINNVFILTGQLGFTIILVSSYVIVSDVYLSIASINRSNKFFLVSFWIIILLLINAILILIISSFAKTLWSSVGILFIYGWGTILTLLSIFSFNFRKMFT